MNRKLIITLIIIGVAILVAGSAIAQDQGRRGGGDGQRGPGMRPVFGVITGIDAGQITIEPMIPQVMLERMAENGRELPVLPDEITLTIDAATQFYFASAKATSDAFSIGDEVVIVAGPGDGETKVALKVADPETAREYIRKKMEDGGGRDKGMRGGEGRDRGMRDGEGRDRGMRDGEGRDKGMRDGEGRGQRPAFGEITAIDDTSVTVSLMIPDFVQAMLDERGIEVPTDMPAEITVGIGERTRFAMNSELVDENPYGVGDLVMVMVGRGDGDAPVAMVISDWASAEARMAEGPRGGQGQGRGPGMDRDKNSEKPRRKPGNRKPQQ